MQKTALIDLLKTFSKDEISNFVDFASSPFFNKEVVLIKFAGYINKNLGNVDSAALNKEKIFAYLYPEKKYNDALIRNIISDMLRLAERFLSVKHLRDDTVKEGIFLLEELYSRGLKKQFIKNKEKIMTRLEKHPYKNEKFYEDKTELTRLYNNFLIASKDTYLRKEEIFQEVSDLMTTGFLMKNIYYNTLMLNNQAHIVNFKHRLNMEEEIDTFINNNGALYLSIPYIECYYLSFKLTQTNEEKYFFRLKEFLDKNFNVLENHECRDIFTVLENYCYKKVMAGNEIFVKEQFSLYRKSIESGSILGSGKKYISNVGFMSIIATGFGAGEFEWVEDFIKKYINEVKENIRQDTYNFSMALMHYWKKDYNKSLTELAKVISDEFAFKQNIKSLILKIYFDLNETESFYSHVDSYKHFILKNKDVHIKMREPVNNYINFTKRLFDIKIRGDADRQIDLEIIKKEISENLALINKIWLLKKADEI